MIYTSLDLLIAELLNVIGAITMYQMLAHKNKNGWLVYFLSSLALIYVLHFKDSWISVINQSMMAILALKNYYLFHQIENKWHSIFDKLTIIVFLGSLYFLNGFDGKSISELVLWCMIITKTILLGKKNDKGWIFQILQQAVSIIFGLYRGLYIYVFKSIIFTFQGIYGYWKWRKTKHTT
ncbi:MAG: nicotinamide mononucleotide transporter [Saprospiraceae bacterium]